MRQHRSRSGQMGRNPIEQGELVNIPKLGTMGTVIGIVKSGGGLLSSPQTKYRVEYALDGKTKRALIPERGVTRLNPLPIFEPLVQAAISGIGWTLGSRALSAASNDQRSKAATATRARHNPLTCPECAAAAAPTQRNPAWRAAHRRRRLARRNPTSLGGHLGIALGVYVASYVALRAMSQQGTILPGLLGRLYLPLSVLEITARDIFAGLTREQQPALTSGAPAAAQS